MNSQNSNDSHPLYLKDYSKLEIIFNAAVEKMNQKKIVYYASDRIFSEEGKREKLEDSFKSFAYALPLSTEDINTEIVDLEKNKNIPISQTILNNKASLISLLEIAGEIPENEESEPIERVKETLSGSEDQISLDDNIFELANNYQENSEEVELTQPNEIINEPVLSESAQKKLERYYLLKEQTLNQIEENKKNAELEVDEEDNDLLINNPEIQPILSKEDLSENFSLEYQPEEESASEEIEEIEELPVTESQSNSDDLYNQILKLSKQPQKNDYSIIPDLLASIQEDDSYLINEKESINESPEEEIADLQESFKEDSDLTEDYQEEKPESFKDEQLSSYITEEILPTEDNIFSEEIREENSTIETQLKKEVPTVEKDHNEVEEKTNQLFENLSDQNNKVSFEARLTQLHKDLTASRATFIVSLVLLGLYVFLMFRSFRGFDYIALVLTLVGIFLAWDLKSKPLTITSIGMLIVLAGCAIFQSVNSGLSMDVTHYVWFLLIPLNISSSYLFMKNRKEYMNLLQNNKIQKKEIKTKPNDNDDSKSVFFLRLK